MTGEMAVRSARPLDVETIVRLNNEFAAEGLMLRRTIDSVMAAVQDYLVVTNDAGEIVACAYLKEYSPSVAEVAGVAVSRAAHGCGLGKVVVAAVEALAARRGIYDVFALTKQPEFFSAIGYQRVDRARYPEKIRRDCLACARRFACNEICFSKNLRLNALAA